jgi:hypothetical protein
VAIKRQKLDRKANLTLDGDRVIDMPPGWAFTINCPYHGKIVFDFNPYRENGRDDLAGHLRDAIWSQRHEVVGVTLKGNEEVGVRRFCRFLDDLDVAGESITRLDQIDRKLLDRYLFWGAGTSLRFIILAWAAVALKLDLEQATQLTALVAVGLAIGSVVAAKAVPLEHAVKVLPLGIAMGFVVLGMVLVTDWRLAVPMLILIGTLAGSFLIPMNALLQHRGHQLMGSGHSIAVQNFNENLSILLMLGAYAMMIEAGFSVNTIVIVFGLFVSVTMGFLTKKHGHDQD